MVAKDHDPFELLEPRDGGREDGAVELVDERAPAVVPSLDELGIDVDGGADGRARVPGPGPAGRHDRGHEGIQLLGSLLVDHLERRLGDGRTAWRHHVTSERRVARRALPRLPYPVASGHSWRYSHQRQRQGAGRPPNARAWMRTTVSTRPASNAASCSAVRVVQASSPASAK